MAEVHPLYPYGPFVFLGVSAVASALLAPRLVRRWDAARNARRAARLGLDPNDMPAFRLSPLLAVLGLGGTLLGLWAAGTLICFAALVGARAIDAGGDAPGTSLDLYVVAHMAPPLSDHVSSVMIEHLATGAEVARFQPGGAVERRLELAAALDPSADAAAQRWTRYRYRTHTGRVALAQPSPVTCSIGMEAFADALREGAVYQLAGVCRNVKGDTGAKAAFKIGDFRNASGAETEAILSRLPFEPSTEPGCIAGGDEIPPDDQPLCRLLHAETKVDARAAILPKLAVEPVWARRWLGAMRLMRGARMPDDMQLAIDPSALMATPLEAIIDEPIAIYLDMTDAQRERLTAAEVASVEVSLAAHRSAFGDHAAAGTRCSRALELAASIASSDAVKVRHLCAAVALRGGELGRARDLLADAPSDALASWLAALDDGIFDEGLWHTIGATDLAGLSGPTLARALSSPGGASTVRRGALPLLFAAAGPDPSLGDWLREVYPACERCDFYDQLAMLTLRKDAARALGDAELEVDLDPILARYRAVFETRPLPLVLRAGRAE